MTIEELIDTIACKAAGEIICEVHGSSFNVLTPVQQAEYMGEIVMHIRDVLTLELAAAACVIRTEQPTPSEWADRDEFDRIVEQFKATP